VSAVPGSMRRAGREGRLAINGPADTAWGTRNAHFADPGGHIWGIAQDLDPQPAS